MNIECICNVAVDVLEEIGHIFINKNKLQPGTKILSLSIEIFSSHDMHEDENFAMNFKTYDGHKYKKFDQLDDALAHLKGGKIE